MVKEMDVLKDLNFQTSDFPQQENNIFKYQSSLGPLYFIKVKSNENLDQQFFDFHRDIWNENKSEIFITILDESKIFICDSKTRPVPEKPIENVKIKSFEYCENTAEAKRYKELLKKENIDNGFFWEEILKFIEQRKKERKRSPIDEDLLKNLIERREKIQGVLNGDGDNISQKLIDRCLFIRFIEDRLGFNKLKHILKDRDVDRLSDLFKYYNGALNGDLFEDMDLHIINADVLYELDKVFGEYYVYSNGQLTLLPYKFDKIPILLISYIYQKFLTKDKRDNEGIIFTPENIADFMVDSIFEHNDINQKAKDGKIKILDSACGSGIFLVKSFERLLKERQQSLNGQLDIHEKSKLLKECIYGIDLDQNALRVAAFSLYLKIFDGIDSKIIQEEVFDRYEKGLEHFMFPGLKEENLISANSLFDDVLNIKFDLILGNPPWGYRFNSDEKKKIDEKWGRDVSQYQSSQCFLHQTTVWMKKDTIVGMVVNISNFINVRATGFRKALLNKYSISSFTTLTRIKEITFKESDEPACILIFTMKKPESEIDFLIPELTQFSKLTGIITIRDDDRFRFLQNKLKDDKNWHVNLLGLNRYLDLIKKIEDNTSPISKYSIILEGLHPYSTEKHKDISEAKKRYESHQKLGPDYYPWVRSIKNVNPFLFELKDNKYIKHGPHLHRPKDIGLFEGDKLIITRSWPLKVAFVCDTILFDNSFDILKLKMGMPTKHLQLFEAILNSKLGFFYLDSLYRQRPEGNFSKVNKQSLRKFPIPDFENKGDVISEIIGTIKEIREAKNIENNLSRLNNLIFDLYGLDYYEKTQLLDYYKLQKRRRRSVVKEEDFTEYIDEFRDSFSTIIKERYTLNAECYLSDFLGALIKFRFSNKNKAPQYNRSRSLKRLIDFIQKDKIIEISYKSLLEEKKLKIYDKKSLIIYKSNHLRDWTRTEAIDDAREEIKEIYDHLPE